MQERIPSLNWLRVFEAAARLESFARAAELLDISTSAVSQQLKALETHLGAELFERGPRHVELTDAGHAFLPSVRQALVTVEETASALFGQAKDNTLTLQCVLIFATGWLAPRLPDFSRSFPQVQLHFSGAYYDVDYQRPGSELKVLFGPVHRSWGQCDRLFDENIHPVASADISNAVQSPADLLRHRLIQVSTHRINWHRVLQSLGLDETPTRQICFVDTTEIALFMAASGYGIALARSPTTDHLATMLGLRPCLTGAGLRSSEAYYLVYQNLETLSRPARDFRQWLLRQAS
jgi:LysR family glycine cleavage system transcriptional activator